MTTPQQSGWYDDPDDPRAQRFWDGQAWTPHRQRKPVAQPVQRRMAAPPEQYSPRPNLPPPSKQYSASPGTPVPGAQPAGVQASSLNRNFGTVLRTNQLAVYLIAGGFGGLAGALVAELVEAARSSFPMTHFGAIFHTAVWFGAYTSVLAAALVVGAEWYQRHDLIAHRIGKAALFGALAGALAGAIAEAIYQQNIGSLAFQNYVLRTFCWGLAGCLMGALLSRTVPNLGVKRGGAAGFIGGAVGGICFLLVCSVLPETLGRLSGMAALGIALGLAMYVVEQLFREASLEVIWAPGEMTRLSLGAQPVTIGGGEDHVFVRGLPEHIASVVFENGQIEYVESANGKRTPLQDGSRMPIGNLELLVHAAR
jgi:uncharacterized membrane protein YeaQ/YmgE (transglycosylase-associated protein family)